MAAPCSMTRLMSFMQKAERTIYYWLTGMRPPGLNPALVCTAGNQCPVSPSNHDQQSLLESIFGSTLWAAVPKTRRSAEVNRTRRFGKIKHFEAANTKKNIVACLHCGHWHERHTICGNCYKRVQDETRQMQEAMGDNLEFHVPYSEVAVVYEGEDKNNPNLKDKFVVEMKKPRPQWFSKHLMSKVHH